MDAKYQFYEIVRVRGAKKTGEEGAVLGKSQDNSGKWGYAIYFYSDERVYDFQEDELESTGRMDKRETFYDGTSVKVVVDRDTGEGYLIEPDEEIS